MRGDEGATRGMGVAYAVSVRGTRNPCLPSPMDSAPHPSHAALPQVGRGRIVRAAALTAVVAALLVALAPLQGALAAVPGDTDVDDPQAWDEARQELAAMGEGYLVWESNRTGRWRLFAMDLDGGGLRQLSPDEPERDHTSPHISPDGERIAYLSYARGDHGYTRQADGNNARLHLIEADGSNDRIIAASARAYFEHRGAVWVDERTLIYIDGDGLTRKLDVDTGDSAALTEQPRETFGYLMNPDLTHATTGRPDFATDDRDSKRITPQQQHAGCQPYFTQDGQWGYWIAGAGGPISRIDLATGEVETMLNRNDRRLPPGRGYLYFPMVSPCQRLLAFGASGGDHDHFRADYDIFLAPLDPESLALIGPPVRYTFDDGTDRYPDVFMQDMPLGSHIGKAPYTLELEAQNEDDPGPVAEWRWDFGDGTTTQGDSVSHTYEEAGRYRITARAMGDDGTVEREIHGAAIIRPATEPRVERVILRDERRIHVQFSEPVQWADAPGAKLESGASVESLELSESGRELDITLAEPPAAADHLELAPMTDRAQQPNRLAEQRLAIERGSWPVAADQLAFMWKTSDSSNLVPDPDSNGDQRRSYSSDMRGYATLDHHWRMHLTGGRFEFEEAGDAIADAIRGTGALTIEATLDPARPEQTGPARILSLVGDDGEHFALVQDGRQLALRLRSGVEAQAVKRHDLFPIAAGRPSHVAITVGDNQLVAYLDGELRKEVELDDPDFTGWTGGALTAGAAADGADPWRGMLEGVAIHPQVLSAEQVRHSHLAYRQAVAGREEPSRLVVEATVRAVSQRPTLELVNPYRRALMMLEYEVDRVLEGQQGSPRLRVAHWGLLDGEPVDIPAEGETVRLELLPLDDTPQSLTEYLHSTLEPDFELPEYYAVPQ